MQREPIVFVGTSDLSGHFRGKSFPLADLTSRLERGVGLAPTNMFISAFGPIQVTTFGTVGEVFLVPDPATRVLVPFEEGPAEYFFVGDIRTAQGEPWNFCPREVLRRALQRLEREVGVQLLATFEQELTYSGGAGDKWQPYDLSSYRRQGFFGEALLAAMRQVGVIPDSFLAEFGPQQYEVTVAPAKGIRAADDAVITRQLAHAVAWRLGQRVSFAPIHEPNGTGSGTHIHFSFLDKDERPVLYDAKRPWHISLMGGQFLAGIQHHLPALCAVTTPAVASYYRLRPNRWAPVRADSAPARPRRGGAHLSALGHRSGAARAAVQRGISRRRRDGKSLSCACGDHPGGSRRGSPQAAARDAEPGAFAHEPRGRLDALERSTAAADWLGEDLLAAYLLFKRAEIKALEGLDENEICRRYAEVY